MKAPKLRFKEFDKDLSTKKFNEIASKIIGNLAFYNDEKIVLDKNTCYINLKSDKNKHFFFNLLQTSNIKNYFEKELTGSTIKNLSLTTIKNAWVFIPELPEQTKIANFLTAIDGKITQAQTQLEAVKRYKKRLVAADVRLTPDPDRSAGLLN